MNLHTFLLLICLCLFNFRIWSGTLRGQRKISSSFPLPNEKAVTQEQRQQRRHEKGKNYTLPSIIPNQQSGSTLLTFPQAHTIKLHCHTQSSWQRAQETSWPQWPEVRRAKKVHQLLAWCSEEPSAFRTPSWPNCSQKFPKDGSVST